MSRQKSSNQQSTSTVSTPITLQDVEGVTLAGNTVGGDLNLTDGGAIKGSLDLAGLTVERAAQLTLDLVSKQAESGKAALDAARESANKGYEFAMNAGRSDVATQQKSMSVMLAIVGIVAAAYVLKGWAGK